MRPFFLVLFAIKTCKALRGTLPAMPETVSAQLLLLCLKFSLNCELATDSSPSFESDTVPIAPPSSAPVASESAAVHPTPNGAVELNPLPVGFGKYGGNLELSLAPHHALIASLAYFDAGNYFNGPQAELGYRFYFYRRTLSGPFVGLGVMAAPFQYHPDPDSNCGGGFGSCPQEESTFLYGAAFDAGWQWIIRDWLLLGVGAGVAVQHAAPRKYELYQSDLTDIAEYALDSGVHLRGLGTVGIVF